MTADGGVMADEAATTCGDTTEEGAATTCGDTTEEGAATTCGDTTEGEAATVCGGTMGEALAAGHTYVLTLGYDGSDFSGFARQTDPLGNETAHTVQGEIEHALELLFSHEVPTVCAGRTDAGVHALGQQVSFDLADGELASDNLERLRRSLNGIMDDHIRVSGVREVHPGFSARFDCVSREYRYRIVVGDIAPLFSRPFVWWLHVPSIDVGAMREASAYLVGEHDFKSFCSAAAGRDANTVRDMRSIDFSYEEPFGERCLVIRVVGNAFLHHMIRIVVGTLAEVGLGRREAPWVKAALEACDRRAAGPTAPASGLTFWHVDYLPDDLPLAR